MSVASVPSPQSIRTYSKWWAWANAAGCTCLDTDALSECPVPAEDHPDGRRRNVTASMPARAFMEAFAASCGTRCARRFCPGKCGLSSEHRTEPREAHLCWRHVGARP